jgi:hypothetical protein
MFAIFGALGQSIYNTLDAAHTAEIENAALNLSQPPRSLVHRIADMKWSPMKVLSDDEYKDMLTRKLLKIDAEIAILDEDVARLKREQMQASAHAARALDSK